MQKQPSMIYILLVFLGSFILFIIAALLIKSTISYLESNSHKSKNTAFAVIISSVFCHYFFYLFGFSKRYIIFSFIVQLLFLSLFEEYPYMKASDIRFILGILLTLINHFYMIINVKSIGLNMFKSLFCFLIIWISPIIIMFSLSATQEIIAFEANKRTLSKKIAGFLENFQNKKISQD